MVSGKTGSEGGGDTISSVLTRWTFAAPQPLVLLQRNGRLIWCNAAAMRLLQGSSPLTLRNGVLTTRRSGANSEFKTWLESVTETPSLHVIKGEPRYSNIVAQAFTVESAGEGVVGCRMRATDARTEVADLVEGLGLTPAQSSIVRRLILGSNIEEISFETDLSITTVRTHLRNIYARLGISSRDDLFQLCLPYIFMDEPPAAAIERVQHRPVRRSWDRRVTTFGRGGR